MDDQDGVLMDNLASLNWNEVSLLLNEVEQNGSIAAPLESAAINDTFDNDAKWTGRQDYDHSGKYLNQGDFMPSTSATPSYIGTKRAFSNTNSSVLESKDLDHRPYEVKEDMRNAMSGRRADQSPLYMGSQTNTAYISPPRAPQSEGLYNSWAEGQYQQNQLGYDEIDLSIPPLESSTQDHQYHASGHYHSQTSAPRPVLPQRLETGTSSAVPGPYNYPSRMDSGVSTNMQPLRPSYPSALHPTAHSCASSPSSQSTKLNSQQHHQQRIKLISSKPHLSPPKSPRMPVEPGTVLNAPGSSSPKVSAGTSTATQPIRSSTVSDTREDPAPLGAYTFDEVHSFLLSASKGNFAEHIPQRQGVSPVNPHGPKTFYVLDRSAALDKDNLYTEKQQDLVRAVRLRSTKKFHWISAQDGLQYRELAQKERKTGLLLDFGGCLYTLAKRQDRNARREIPNPQLQFLQVWHLSETPAYSRSKHPLTIASNAGSSTGGDDVNESDKEEEEEEDTSKKASPRSGAGIFGAPNPNVPSKPIDPIKMEPVERFYSSSPAASSFTSQDSGIKRHQSSSPSSTDEHDLDSLVDPKRMSRLGISKPTTAPRLGSSTAVQKVVFEIHNRTCSSVGPLDWKSWIEKYGKFLQSENFAKALKLYITQEDPRLKEDFLFPDAMIDGLPLGTFRATLDVDISANGGTCLFSDDTFNKIVGQNPVGMKGFFVSILSPLQRLCISRIWFKRIGENGGSYMNFFSRWRVTQSAYTLKNGEVKVLRSNNRLTPDKNGTPFIDVRIQDVTHLYPNIVALPPFLE